MTKIVLVRHGHVEGIHPPRFRGREDLPLTKRGNVEAQAVAQRIESEWRPEKVYTSPLSRCIATGGAIANACGIEAQSIEQLKDMNYGTWQMKSYEEMATAEPKLYATWFAAPHLMRFPGGDSLQELVSRSADALRLVLERHRNGTVVLVSHDSINRALLLQLADLPLSSYWRLAQDPCCINEIDVDDGRIIRAAVPLDLDQRSGLRGADRSCDARYEASFQPLTLGRPPLSPPESGLT